MLYYCHYLLNWPALLGLGAFLGWQCWVDVFLFNVRLVFLLAVGCLFKFCSAVGVFKLVYR
jgi:hypothetical protein